MKVTEPTYLVIPFEQLKKPSARLENLKMAKMPLSSMLIRNCGSPDLGRISASCRDGGQTLLW